MTHIKKMKDNIEAASGDPAELERLYREATSRGDDDAFKNAVRTCREVHPDNVLLEAWARRLDLPVLTEEEGGRDRRWWAVVVASVVVGLASVLLARGKPPVPFPDEADALFWIGWGPLVATGLLGYIAWAQRSVMSVARYGAAVAAVAAVALYAGLTHGGESGDAAFLASIHNLFICWAAVGAALCLGYPHPGRESYAYLVKSMEAVITGGLFFGTGLIFVGLTYGIFAVLGIELPEEDLQTVAAWGVGAIPILAIGSVYDPTRSPAAQDWHAGLTRTLRILSRLVLPLALGVLLVYVLWFIPAYFQKPFEEREVLIVYNATILAIMALLTVVVSGPADVGSVRREPIFRYAVIGLGGLTLILNVYALAAVLSRALESGLTPNRFAVIGWNVTTLVILLLVGVRLWRERGRPWMTTVRESIGSLAPLAAAWALLLLLVLPFL